jgi:hypothetical protein
MTISGSAIRPITPPHAAPEGIVKRSQDILILGIPKQSSVSFRSLVLLAMVLGAATIGASAAIHLHLWLGGYRHVPRLGPLFLGQVISGFVLAPIIVVFRRMFAVLAGAMFQAASAIGLTLSATVGFVGVHDGFDVPWATPSIIVELIGFLVLAASGWALWRRNLQDRNLARS